MADIRVPMPNNWVPRRYQLPALQALDGGCKRVLLLWHRKSGKDTVALNWVATEMADKPTSVLYMLPELGQAKRIVFRELNDNGERYLDQAFPHALRDGQPNTQDGFLRLKNGSVFQLGGFDSIDRYIGAGPKIIIMSEYAVSVHAERAWQLLQPILLRNGGIAIFPYTPRGNGHGRKLFEAATKSSDWFVSKLGVDDTGLEVPSMTDGRPDGGKIPLAKAVMREVEAGVIDEDYARQEFWCSWEAPNSGSYYGKILEKANNRITDVPWDPSLPVFSWWDIGISDATAIWFVQAHRGGELRCIDYYEAEGEPLSHYLDILNRKCDDGWIFEPRGQLVPHDFGAREFVSGETREQAARKLGWRMTVVPAESVDIGIDAVRRVLPRCWFDAKHCAAALERLRLYTKRWSAQLAMFTGPQHDVNSHCADAFRTGVMGMRLAGMHIAKNLTIAEREGKLAMTGNTRPVVAVTDFSVWGQ